MTVRNDVILGEQQRRLELARMLSQAKKDNPLLDDATYPLAEEDLEEARKRDPVRSLQEQLIGAGLLPGDTDSVIRNEAKRVINEATDYVDAAPYPEATDFLDHVYS